VHVPFCRHRCGYCNFSVLAGRDDLADSFLNALAWELSQLGTPRPVETLFIGGGTPTHLPPQWLGRMLELVTTWLPVAEQGEFSVEANPGDIDAERLRVLQDFGVNRISLGVQSFASEKLRVLQRDHDHAIASRAIEAAAATIGNVSIDLIFAAPDETPQQWLGDLRTAFQLPIRHLSTYALTYEKGTQFWTRRAKQELHNADEAVELEMYQQARSLAADAGLPQYEISSFAAPAARCRHNLHYWEGRGWHAFGPGAAGFVDGCRATNHRSPTQYIRRCLQGDSPVAEREPITAVQWASERAAFGVRRIDGVDLNTIQMETGVDVEQLRRDKIAECLQWELVTLTRGRLRLTEKGIPLADTVSSALL